MVKSETECIVTGGRGVGQAAARCGEGSREEGGDEKREAKGKGCEVIER